MNRKEIKKKNQRQNEVDSNLADKEKKSRLSDQGGGGKGPEIH